MSKKKITEDAAENPTVTETQAQNENDAAQPAPETEEEKIEALRALYAGKSSIYAGPNLHGGKLVSCSTFRGGLPPHVLKLVMQHPEIKALIVPVKDFAKTKQRAETKGSELHRVYEQLKALRFREEEVKA